jgi:hypothetical protein
MYIFSAGGSSTVLKTIHMFRKGSELKNGQKAPELWIWM